ncbi:TetR/AcrR family transcriptional regulator [Actinomadura darangshiensis]|uniref:TetR/AcrR family transcriptional regulator n=1 Tax=Actinomadura darangshiensis TaxID=705336 RepID=UPI001A9CFB10|nr:TetR family transcriptional regulator [Actinomadura darangshiensis]
MPTVIRAPHSSRIEQGPKPLAHRRPDAVRVEVLAQALDVTKGGFYGHFADRKALLAALLDTWERGLESRRARVPLMAVQKRTIRERSPAFDRWSC